MHFLVRCEFGLHGFALITFEIDLISVNVFVFMHCEFGLPEFTLGALNSHDFAQVHFACIVNSINVNSFSFERIEFDMNSLECSLRASRIRFFMNSLQSIWDRLEFAQVHLFRA